MVTVKLFFLILCFYHIRCQTWPKKLKWSTESDETKFKLESESKLNASAKMAEIIKLDEKIASMLVNPNINDSLELYITIGEYNEELDKIQYGLRTQDHKIVYIAKLMYFRRGPRFVEEDITIDGLREAYEYGNLMLARFFRRLFNTTILYNSFLKYYFRMQVDWYCLEELQF